MQRLDVVGPWTAATDWRRHRQVCDRIRKQQRPIRDRTLFAGKSRPFHDRKQNSKRNADDHHRTQNSRWNSQRLDLRPWSSIFSIDHQRRGDAESQLSQRNQRPFAKFFIGFKVKFANLISKFEIQRIGKLPIVIHKMSQIVLLVNNRVLIVVEGLRDPLVRGLITPPTGLK